MTVIVRLPKGHFIGSGTGRDDGYYCDVLSSGVNLFLVEGFLFLFSPLSFIVWDIEKKLAASSQYNRKNKTLIVCYFLQESSNVKGSSLYVIRNAHTAFLLRTFAIPAHEPFLSEIQGLLCVLFVCLFVFLFCHKSVTCSSMYKH